MRRVGILACALLLVLAALVWFGWRDSAPPSRARAASSAPASVAEAPADRRGTASSVAASPAAPPPPGAPPDADPRTASRTERVADALALLRFPPTSQPLRAEMTDVLQPNRRWETPLPLSFATGAASGRNDPNELTYLFTADAYAVVGATPLHVTLEAYRASASGEPTRIAVQVNDVSVTSAGAPAPRSLGPLLRDDGESGDRAASDDSYGGAVSGAAWAGASGLVRLTASFTVNGESRPAQASLDVRVTAREPATFDGIVAERRTDDGLELDVGMQVREAGHYFVQGLLFDRAGAPIGFAVARPALAAGQGIATLAFWGLMFHESKAQGPYELRTLTGHRLPEGDEPERTDLTTWEGPYRTHAYVPGDFSDKEFESPAKERKVRALADLAGRAPSP